MQKSLFEIEKMDCSSEEQLIRMKLQGISAIRHLDFELDSRHLTVYHEGEDQLIEDALQELKLGSKLLQRVPTDETKFREGASQKKLLWTVLAINLTFFFLELISGILSSSMGLIADSLDMLADSIVYSLSLIAIGGSILFKKKIARISGYFQVVLAIIGFSEVIRRFLGSDGIPDYMNMILISIMALIANGFCLYILQRSKSREAHMQASMIFTSNDILINAGVVLAGLMVFWFDSNKPDLIIGSLVFGLVIRGAMRIIALGK